MDGGQFTNVSSVFAYFGEPVLVDRSSGDGPQIEWVTHQPRVAVDQIEIGRIALFFVDFYVR